MNYLLKYKKYKNKYMDLKKQLGGVASSAVIVNRTNSIANTELNQLWQSIGFEFEYSGYYIGSKEREITNALEQAHNKLKITLPDTLEFQDVELQIGNDGPYESSLGGIYYNLEMTVTFKNKTKCQNMYECYNKALDICKIFLHDSFVRVNDVADPTNSIIKHKSDLLTLEINIYTHSFHMDNCLSQCTIAIPYNNIKTVFSIILNNDKYNKNLKTINIYEAEFIKIFNTIKGTPIELTPHINNWIFLLSHYYNYIVLYDPSSRILKTSMPLIIRHGLISIMPQELVPIMEKIILKKITDTSNNYIFLNNYLYYLYRFGKLNNFENNVELVVSKYNKFIFQPHESNHFNYTYDHDPNKNILFVEYRTFQDDDVLQQRDRDIDKDCFNKLELMTLDNSLKNTSVPKFIISKENITQVISKTDDLKANVTFENEIKKINDAYFTNLDELYEEPFVLNYYKLELAERIKLDDAALNKLFDKTNKLELDSKYFSAIEKLYMSFFPANNSSMSDDIVSSSAVVP